MVLIGTARLNEMCALDSSAHTNQLITTYYCPVVVKLTSCTEGPPWLNNSLTGTGCVAVAWKSNIGLVLFSATMDWGGWDTWETVAGVLVTTGAVLSAVCISMGDCATDISG